MKARKAAVAAAGIFAMVLARNAGGTLGYCAADEGPSVILTAERVVADADGHFEATVSLEKLPAEGISALEFAVAYDTAAMSVTDVKLLYDTGAQAAELLVHPDFAGTVFQTEYLPDMVWVRWTTALTDPDYWLSEERPLLAITGTLSDEIPAGSMGELRVVPAPCLDADGNRIPAQAIAAGCIDAEGNVSRKQAEGRDGAVWKRLDETGATMYGDLNLDGVRTAADAVLMMRVVTEDTAFCAAAYANADCDADNVLTVGDVTLILQALSGKPDVATLGKES